MATKTKAQKNRNFKGYLAQLTHLSKEELRQLESLSMKDLLQGKEKTHKEWKEFVESKVGKEKARSSEEKRIGKKAKGNGGKDGRVRSNSESNLPSIRTFSVDDPPQPSDVNMLLQSLRSKLARDCYEETRETWRVETIASMYISLIGIFAELNGRVLKGKIKTEALIKAADVIALRISTLDPYQWERVRASFERKLRGNIVDVTPSELSEFDAVMGRDRPEEESFNAAHPKGDAKAKRKKE